MSMDTALWIPLLTIGGTLLTVGFLAVVFFAVLEIVGRVRSRA